jgi:hypothetical protein
LVRRVLLVSCPTVLGEVFTSAGPLFQSISLLTHWKALKLRLWAGGGLFFRHGNLFKAKPHGRLLASQCKVPARFLVGAKDGLVLPRLSRAVFDSCAAPKTWTVFEEGFHAEYMAVMQRDNFLAWVKASLR